MTDRSPSPAWLVEYRDKRMSLGDIDSPQLLAMVEPVRDHIRGLLQELEADRAINGLKIVFSWREDTTLQVAFKGPSDVVNAAVDVIGDTSEFWSHH